MPTHAFDNGYIVHNSYIIHTRSSEFENDQIMEFVKSTLPMSPQEILGWPCLVLPCHFNF